MKLDHVILTRELVSDMAAEAESLDQLVASLAGNDWRRPTPATGWTIAHQVGHLAWTDELAVLSATAPAQFDDVLAQAWQAPASYVDGAAAEIAASPPSRVLGRWRASRLALADALTDVSDGVRLRWFGPPMSPASMATARLMEVWAHGLDIADALGVARPPTDRIRAVAHLGVRTRDFAYIVNGRTPPATQLRVELVAPSGAQWSWGPEDATDSIVGTAEDFCALVTQRRHRADLDLEITGSDADEWSDIAQCFAGPPGTGREATAGRTVRRPAQPMAPR